MGSLVESYTDANQNDRALLALVREAHADATSVEGYRESPFGPVMLRVTTPDKVLTSPTDLRTASINEAVSTLNG